MWHRIFPLELAIQLLFTQLISLTARIMIKLNIIQMFLTPRHSRSLIIVNDVINIIVENINVFIKQDICEHSTRIS